MEEESGLKGETLRGFRGSQKRKIVKEEQSAVSSATEGSSKTPKVPSGFGTSGVQLTGIPAQKSHPLHLFSRRLSFI